MKPAGSALLCVCNYPSNTGYAWDFIEGLYASLARRLEPRGVETFVAYTELNGAPRALEGSPAKAVALDARLGTAASADATTAFIRQHGVRTIYLTDRPTRSVHYARLHLTTGVDIVVHDHTSGARSRPDGLRRLAKWLTARVPLIQADAVIAVSEFVRQRQLEVAMLPAGRVRRIWNGIPVPPPPPPGRPLHAALGLAVDRPVVVCACRAAPEKGVSVLLRAFDKVWRQRAGSPPTPLLVYMGDGPQFRELCVLRESLESRDAIVLTGYRADAGQLIAGADLCVMPSVWEDALPLAVMQPMALGKAVVASRVGGIPEMIVDGESGVLVPADDAEALAGALGALLDDPGRAARLGAAARDRVSRLFGPEQQIDALAAVVGRRFPS